MKRISIKIFLWLMISFIIILGVSFKLNMDSQVELYKSFLIASYNYDNKFDMIKQKFPIKSSDAVISQGDMIEETKTEKFKSDFQSLAGHYLNTYMFYIRTNYYNESVPVKSNVILDSVFIESIFSDNHIYFFDDSGRKKGVSIEDLSIQQKKSLLKYIENQLSLETTKDECRVYYSEDNGKLKYLEWGDQCFGEKTETVVKGNIVYYYILEDIIANDSLRGKYQKQNIEDLESIIEVYMRPHNSGMDYNVNSYEKKDVTYFVMESPYWQSTSPKSEETFIVAVNVVYDLNGYISELYVNQNIWLYAGAFAMAVFVSWLFSYMISKPIRKVEKAAVKTNH